MSLELSLKQEPPKVFAGDDEFKGRPGDNNLVREVDEYLKRTGQMGLLVGGVLTKELPRKDLDVIVTGEDIKPGELGVDWWWVDLTNGQTRNRTDFRIDVSPLARRALSKRIPGLYVLKDVFDVKNENLPATYTTLHEITRDYSSPVLNGRLFTPVQIQYRGGDIIGILQAYDDVFIELRDAVVLPGKKGSDQYGLTKDFGNIEEGAIRSGISRLYVFWLANSVAGGPERIKEAYREWDGMKLSWKGLRKALYLVFHGQEYEEAQLEGKKLDVDPKIEEMVEKLGQFKAWFDKQPFKDEKSCYSLIRGKFSFDDYFNALDVVPAPDQWHKDRELTDRVLRGNGRYIGNIAINKLSIGEIK